MPGYISELDYFGASDQEFVEIAVPTGTDVSSYTLVFYQADGTIYNTVSLGSFTGTYGGQDVYVVDQSTPGFDSGGDAAGTFYPDDSIALVDDNGTVLQFVSWEGNTVTATEGPASGMSSTNLGTSGESLQSDNGGSSYYAQSSSNKGSIPACYAPGTWIDTPDGERLVEHLRAGDVVWTVDNGPQTIRWVWDGDSPTGSPSEERSPILIRAGALGPGLPVEDLIVSAQHRILVGASRQLASKFAKEAFAPAKALTSLPGIQRLQGCQAMRWIHFSCDHHEVVRANGCLSESLFLGPMVLRNLPRGLRSTLRRLHQVNPDLSTLNGPLARTCLTAGQAERSLRRARRAALSISHFPQNFPVNRGAADALALWAS